MEILLFSGKWKMKYKHSYIQTTDQDIEIGKEYELWTMGSHKVVKILRDISNDDNIVFEIEYFDGEVKIIGASRSAHRFTEFYLRDTSPDVENVMNIFK